MDAIKTALKNKNYDIEFRDIVDRALVEFLPGLEATIKDLPDHVVE